MITSIANVKITLGTKVKLLTGKYQYQIGTIFKVNKDSYTVSLLTKAGIRYLVVKPSNLLKQAG